jgi:hypothetical protein
LFLSIFLLFSSSSSLFEFPVIIREWIPGKPIRWCQKKGKKNNILFCLDLIKRWFSFSFFLVNVLCADVVSKGRLSTAKRDKIKIGEREKNKRGCVRWGFL